MNVPILDANYYFDVSSCNLSSVLISNYSVFFLLLNNDANLLDLLDLLSLLYIDRLSSSLTSSCDFNFLNLLFNDG